MSYKNKTILWSPAAAHSDKFVVASDALRLYETKGPQGGRSLIQGALGPGINSNNGFKLLDTVAFQQQSIKCASWCQNERNPLLMAAGPCPHHNQPQYISTVDTGSIFGVLGCAEETGLTHTGLFSGRVVLLRFFDENKRVKEFVPRYARACNVVAWNKHIPQQIAVGLDRVRNGCGYECVLLIEFQLNGDLSPFIIYI